MEPSDPEARPRDHPAGRLERASMSTPTGIPADPRRWWGDGDPLSEPATWSEVHAVPRPRDLAASMRLLSLDVLAAVGISRTRYRRPNLTRSARTSKAESNS